MHNVAVQIKVHADIRTDVLQKATVDACCGVASGLGMEMDGEGDTTAATDQRTMGWSLYVMHTASLLAIAA